MKIYLIYSYNYSVYGHCRFIGFIRGKSELDACNNIGLETEIDKNGKVYGLFKCLKGNTVYQEIFFKELGEITTLEQIGEIICNPPPTNRAV